MKVRAHPNTPEHEAGREAGAACARKAVRATRCPYIFVSECGVTHILRAVMLAIFCGLLSCLFLPVIGVFSSGSVVIP